MIGSAGRSVVVGVAIALLAGCSAIPAGGDPALDPAIAALARMERPRIGRIAVAPIMTVTLATDEVAKGWHLGAVEAFGPVSLRHDVRRALEASGSWDRVREGEGDALADAWSHRDDVIATVAIEDVRTRFDGHNGWWIPNMVNFVTNTPVAWWIATEEYSLSLDATVTLTSVQSGLELARRKVPVTVSGTFDDFDRGWQFFGPIQPSLDGDNWRTIATRLIPAAQRKLAVGVAVEVDASLRTPRDPTEVERLRRKTLVLAVGITHYQDSLACPPLAYSREDAQRVSNAFGALGEPPQHLVTLVDDRASAAAVSSAIDEHLGRARAGDCVILYFAGYGTRSREGKPLLVFHKGGTISLDELCHRLGQLPGEKLLIIDAGFAGSGRSISVPTEARLAPAPLVQGDRLAVVLAGEPEDPVLAPEHLASGLLTYHFLRQLGLIADDEHHGSLGVAALLASVRVGVVADAELLGVHQVPWVAGLSEEFKPSLGTPRSRGDEP